MTDTLNRCVALVAPGTGGGSDLTTDLRALASATGHLMVSDTNHLANENPLRTLFTHHGAIGTKSLYAPTLTGVTTTPSPEDIDWTWQPIDCTGTRTGHFTLRMGSHAIHRASTGRRWPSLRCKLRMKAPSGYTMGVVLCAVRGIGAPTNASPSAGTFTTATTFQDVTLSLDLDDESTLVRTADIAPGYASSGVLAAPEPSSINVLTLWLGAYCTSGSAANVASIGGIVVYLVEPT
jgi:hypothetical protein